MYLWQKKKPSAIAFWKLQSVNCRFLWTLRHRVLRTYLSWLLSKCGYSTESRAWHSHTPFMPVGISSETVRALIILVLLLHRHGRVLETPAISWWHRYLEDATEGTILLHPAFSPATGCKIDPEFPVGSGPFANFFTQALATVFPPH